MNCGARAEMDGVEARVRGSIRLRLISRTGTTSVSGLVSQFLPVEFHRRGLARSIPADSIFVKVWCGV